MSMQLRSPLPLSAVLDEVLAGRDVPLKLEGSGCPISAAKLVDEMCKPLVLWAEQLVWYYALTED